ncbi:hypothetical protein [Roseofilum casamattae]|uniref:Uncharacterized protein n=1 Tax=Roseofilum casamattae BLCC-M143 TaxID=3022442 RepID=A0ABT7BWM6_9CYAN|nr:hypothetical protein [Roseofilum casamattae]MDJ1183581.1 hypothetical protein [Roseofilum casamattae BLCC-M143]
MYRQLRRVTRGAIALEFYFSPLAAVFVVSAWHKDNPYPIIERLWKIPR